MVSDQNVNMVQLKILLLLFCLNLAYTWPTGFEEDTQDFPDDVPAYFKGKTNRFPD